MRSSSAAREVAVHVVVVVPQQRESHVQERRTVVRRSLVIRRRLSSSRRVVSKESSRSRRRRPSPPPPPPPPPGGGGGGVFVILREEMRPLVVVVFGREGNGPNAYTQHEEASRWTRLAADAILLLLRRRCCSRLPPLMINVIGSPPLVRLFFALHAARGLSRRHGNTSLIATDVRHELCRCYCMHACACIHARGRVIHTIVLLKGIWRQGVTMTSPPPGWSPLHQIKTPKK